MISYQQPRRDLYKTSHKEGSSVANIGEVVFGLQDGMVSTLGAITGIAIGSGEHYIILLAGCAIIAVESVSMGIGAYVSSNSEKDVVLRMQTEEREEISTYPADEHQELEELFVRDGWPSDFSKEMVRVAKTNPDLMLTEMSYRELGIALREYAHPVQNGIAMFVAYIAGGLVPLLAYFFLPIELAIRVSIGVTLAGLFIVGAGLTRYTKVSWIRSGLSMFTLGGIALAIGLSVGVFMRTAFGV